ncbi:MAG TPA: BTAD domain-containing putative transcriptional regulator [Thermoanaerobaculia bacterium]|nr:BTAD domain-containing putative transcriptional regulator [Thermoanaerobaculia bacterium]
MAAWQRSSQTTARARIVEIEERPGLRVHCFGTLRVSWAGNAVDGFESQKVRGLFAYLVCHRGQALSRDHLAAVFWPGKDEEAARRNLRQSLYNLRSLFPRERPAILANRHSVELDSQLDAWIDVLAFEEALERGGSSGGGGDRLDTHRLSEAVSLYRGDFLAGFQVRDSEEFEYWLAAEQGRLREQAVAALRLLIDRYLERGEHRPGIQYAQRLVAIDPLSEDAHQKLMRLYSLSGRRSRALAQYEELARVLRRELDVEPLEETTALQQKILRLEASQPLGSGSGEDSSPVIPMAGRRGEYEQLESCMHSALAGSSLFTLVEGEPGTGKTRLIRSLLDALSSQPGTLVLKGSCLDVLPESFQPLSRALRSVLVQGPAASSGLLRRLDAETLSALALIAPELNAIEPSLPSSRGASPERRRQRLYQAIERFLISLCEGTGGVPCRVALLLDDLERADPALPELLRHLSTPLREQPIWIVGACSRDRLAEGSPLRQLLDEVDPGHVVRLGRLHRDSVYEIASSLVGTGQAETLAEFLHRSSQGLPHALADSVNLLRDRGLLRPDSGRWSLVESSLGEVQLKLGDLRGLIAARVQHLPYSARRLASLAAVAGSRFEAGLIAIAAEEHPVVCDIAFDIMLQRWLIRRSPERWYHRQRPANGAEREPVFYEFSSESIWKAIYADIQTTRRRLMHRQVGETLEREHAADPLPACESLAYHFRAAGLHRQAMGYLALAAAKAERCGATETALYYYGLAEEAIEMGLRRASTAEKARYERERERLRQQRGKLRPAV